MHLLSDLWQAMWPNIFAPSFFTVLGISISHFKIKGHVNKKHAELHEHVDHVHRQLHRKIDGIKND